MAYKIEYTPAAVKQLSKLDKPVARRIIDYMDNISKNPTASGKSLKHEYRGYWRYRVADYRVITFIDNEIMTVLIVKIGHRKEVYT